MTENRTEDFPNMKLYTVEVPVLISCPRLNSVCSVSINSSPICAIADIAVESNEKE
jgi:hypothetical protein